MNPQPPPQTSINAMNSPQLEENDSSKSLGATRSLTEKQLDQLVEWFRPWPSVIVAYSGGVDSALVGWGAVQALGNSALAVTALSPSVSENDRELSAAVAHEMGIQHQTIHTQEIELAEYRANSPTRCYFCKSTLYSTIRSKYPASEFPLIVNGTNLDDLGNHRPGLAAAKEFQIRSPLVELGYNKQIVRSLAHLAGLTVHDRPASPCLASRIAYGVEVTSDRLLRVERAEKYLRSLGFQEFRVRIEPGELARIELHPEDLTQLVSSPMREACVRVLRELGFRQICLDLAGFRSGSHNELIQFNAASK
ncbi:ATP-dependent sacrificial sulfur transferase LarE [Planctopirus hydrillae]|uniref:ATP-dependent sacrificial sulfur transferase LarE n=1 Tax=Planctopirus hydrillae TaxID=1841610 RepID=UPI0009F5092E|nr:ATP-dependent sacrificial sulfur transferase LarE [Planctopirus hydrillae]